MPPIRVTLSDYASFVDPPAAFRSVPFWSLNDVLTPAEIERQMEEFKRGGFGGAYLHSRIGLLTEYLGDDWWEAMDAGVRAAERLGIEAWFYDEDKWPSGFAGGKVPLASEDFHARALVRLDKSAPLPDKSDVLAQDDRYRYVCCKAPMGDPWFNGTCWVDLLNPETVKAFIDCSYRPYAERYADKAGCAVQGIFTDEPQVSPGIHTRILDNKGSVSYSPIIRDDFKAQHGYDFVDHIAGLFDDVGDYRKLRLDYLRTVARRFEESFSRQIGQYCRRAGMVLTGHYNGEGGLRSVLVNVGNMMIHYRHMQRPGIDHLGLHIDGALNAARSLSSVANQYGQPRRLSEMFGGAGQNMSFEDRKWIADFHAVLGVNHVCPHLSLYSLKGCRKRDYPPTISPQQPYWTHNKLVEDYMARISYMTTVGRYAPEVLVVHPLESAFAEYVPSAPAEVDQRSLRYYHVLQALQEAHRDYDLGDEEILSDIGSTDGAVLRVGVMSYKAVVLPHMLTIRPSTLMLLAAFADAGGPVFVVGDAPQYVDGEPDDGALGPLSRTARAVSLADLPGSLETALPAAVTLEGSGCEHVWVHRRVVEDGGFVMLANTSRLEAAEFRILFEEGTDRPTVWDPATGDVMHVEPDRDGGFSLRLAEAQSLILATGSLSAQADVRGTYERPQAGRRTLELTGPWSGRRLEPNAITLDFARYSTDGGSTFSQPEPVLGIHQRFTRDQYSGPLRLAFDVRIDTVPPQCSLVVEQPEMFQSITVNGEDLSFKGDEFYRDSALRKADIPSPLAQGINTIELALDYVAAVPDSLDARTRYGSEIESIYLIGEFGVYASPPDEPPAPTQLNASGHFPAHPLHRFSGFSIGDEAGEFDGDLVPQGYCFYNGAFKISRKFEMPDIEDGKRYFLKLSSVEATVVAPELNGKPLRPAAWSPWEIEITEALRTGANELTLTLVNTLRNLLGPHHHRDGELTLVGPDSFTGRTTWTGGGPGEDDWYDVRLRGETKIWRDDYHFVPFGLLAAPVIEER